MHHRPPSIPGACMCVCVWGVGGLNSLVCLCLANVVRIIWATPPTASLRRSSARRSAAVRPCARARVRARQTFGHLGGQQAGIYPAACECCCSRTAERPDRRWAGHMALVVSTAYEEPPEVSENPPPHTHTRLIARDVSLPPRGRKDQTFN